jgi:endogenous inhibitor of DNA gyrase (YacG/DUF329 family)
MPKSELKVPCPTCGKPSIFATSNRWRPFCSERCRNHDLGAWASEQFRIAPAQSEGDPEPPDQGEGPIR